MLEQVAKELKPVMQKSAWQLGGKELRVWLMQKANERVLRKQKEATINLEVVGENAK